MHIFKCLAYVYIPSEEWSKLDSKSNECIFLKFKKGVKWYMFRDPVPKRMVISMDVVFGETSMINTFRKEEESHLEGSRGDINRLVVQVELDDVEF